MRHDPFMRMGAAGCAAALVLVACGGGSGNRIVQAPLIVGSGIIVSETRALPDFHGVDVSIGEFDIEITQTGTQSVRIETDDNIIDEIWTYVSGGVLIIETQANYDTDHNVRIFIDMIDVRSLRVTGVGSLSASGLSTSGDLTVAKTGVGGMTLSGVADTYHATTTGVGGIDAGALRTRTASIHLGGTGDCRITVTEVLNGTISGQGNIYYAGNPPVVNATVTGYGALIPM